MFASGCVPVFVRSNSISADARVAGASGSVNVTGIAVERRGVQRAHHLDVVHVGVVVRIRANAVALPPQLNIRLAKRTGRQIDVLLHVRAVGVPVGDLGPGGATVDRVVEVELVAVAGYK